MKGEEIKKASKTNEGNNCAKNKYILCEKNKQHCAINDNIFQGCKNI